MLKNYLLIALRHLHRHKGYAFINVAGLALGMACCVLILLYVRNERSYDHFHEQADHLFRVGSEEYDADGVTRSASSPVPLGPTLKETYPEAREVIRFWRGFRPVLRYEDRAYREDGLYFTDPAVFQVFSFDLLAGDPRTALTAPHTIVLTPATARKYFGRENPMGRQLAYDGYPGGDSLRFTVTGILDELPPNTHFEFDALASLVGIETERDNFGSDKPIWTYVRLADGTTPEQLEAKLPAFSARYLDTETQQERLYLEPITSLHLYSRFEGGFKPRSDITYVYLFSIIGFIILLIACINFINLATARSAGRAKEVGMRKVLGAQRRQLIYQFLGEALLLSVLALLLGLMLVELLLPLFNRLFDLALAIDYFSDRSLLFSLVALVLTVGLLAGLYPAFFLSYFRPITALKGRTGSASGSTGLRKGLVVFQFAVSVILLIGTALVYQQLAYMRSKDLGIQKEQVVVLPYSPDEEPLLEALRRHPGVLHASVSQRVPVSIRNTDTRPVRPEGFGQNISSHSYIIDDAFLDTYGIELVAGRNLSRTRTDDANAFLINEAAVRRFGWASPQEALGKQMSWPNADKTGPIIGVVEDFHLASMHEEIPTLVLHTLSESQWWRTFISVKIRPENVAQTLSFLEDTWKAHTPEGAYEYFFIDDSFAQLHRADERLGRIFSVFASVAILVACLGLFGLVAFTAEQRTKEIGIRKVLGASAPGIVLLLSKDFALLVLKALVPAVPIAYVVMGRWLDTFAYHVDLGPGIMLAACGLALLIAVATVSYQSVKAALADPVDALRYE